MKIKKRHIILLILFLITFILRLFFSLQTPYFQDDTSYHALRQIEHITKTGKPFFEDNLTYNNQTTIVLPGYYYLLSLFYMFFPSIMFLKIINNFLASTIVISTYLISSSIVRKRRVAIIMSIVASMIPLYISKTLNSLNPTSIIYPGLFFLIYFFLRLEKNKENINYIIPLTLFLVLSSDTISILILSSIFFLLFNYLSNMNLEKIQKEYLYFFFLFFLWSNFIIYKNVFLEYGISILWKNKTAETLIQQLNVIDFNTLIASLGIFPFIFGSYTSYKYLFKKKSKKINFFISVYISSLTLLILQLDPSNNTILFISTSLIILFGVYLRDFLSHFRKTKLIKSKNTIYALFFVVLSLTQVLPGFIELNHTIKSTPKEDYFNSLNWLKENSKNESIILSSIVESQRIKYFTKRKIIGENNAFLNTNYDETKKDIKTAFSSRSKIDVTEILEKYDVDYVFVSSITLDSYEINTPKDILDCLDIIYQKNTISIYKRNKEKCSLKRI